MTYFEFFQLIVIDWQKTICFAFSKVISYYSRRGGLGGVSIINEKSDFSLLSQLLIRDANPDDQVIIIVIMKDSYGLVLSLLLSVTLSLSKSEAMPKD